LALAIFTILDTVSAGIGKTSNIRLIARRRE